MLVEDQLLTITEVAIALAGFAGVVASFQFSDNAHPTRGNATGLTIMILISLNVALFSVFPLAVSNFGVTADMVWIVSGTLFGISYLFSIQAVLSSLKSMKVRSTAARNTFYFLQLLNVTATVALFLSVANILVPRGPGVYIVALIFPLTVSGYMFVRLVVRPLWKSIHAHEAAENSAI